MTAETVPRLGNLPAEPNSFVGRERDLGDLRLLLEQRPRADALRSRAASARPGSRPGSAGSSPTSSPMACGSSSSPTAPTRRWPPARSPPSSASATSPTGRLPPLSPTRCAAGSCCSSWIPASTWWRRSRTSSATSSRPARCCGWWPRAGSRCAFAARPCGACQPLSLPALPPHCPARTPPARAPARPDRQRRRPPEDAAEHEAIRLFVDRAAAVRPGFALTSENREHVVQLCRTLDGVPLAIELAAARIRALSVEQIAGRIDDRFRLLASGDRTAPPRQQTLQAAVDWSFDLLTADEQILLRRLSVFAGWSLEMAEQVCADERIPEPRVLDLLAALIDKSLVALEDELAGDARYRLLDTIREYASARLEPSGEQDEFRRRHARLHAGPGRGRRRAGVPAQRAAVGGAGQDVLPDRGRAGELPVCARRSASTPATPSRACGCARPCARRGWCRATWPRASSWFGRFLRAGRVGAGRRPGQGPDARRRAGVRAPGLSGRGPDSAGRGGHVHGLPGRLPGGRPAHSRAHQPARWPRRGGARAGRRGYRRRPAARRRVGGRTRAGCQGRDPGPQRPAGRARSRPSRSRSSC